MPAGRRRRGPGRRLSHRICRLHQRPRTRPDEDINDGRRTGGRIAASVPADARHLDHAAPRLSGGPRQRLQPAGGVQPLRQSLHHHPAGGNLRRARAIPAARREIRRRHADRGSHRQRRSRRSRAHLGHHLHQPRHPRQPRRQRAHRKRLGRSRLPGRRACCCRRTSSTRPTSRPGPRKCGLASTGEGPFQWLIGAFYSDVNRVYAQRLPTPGYDVFTDARFGAGTSVAVANGFPLNSPYNADLPYDIKQKAMFGEASYDITEALTATAGLRYYDFKENRGASTRAASSRTATTRPTRPSPTASRRACCSATRRPTTSSSISRPRRASGWAASTIRSTRACAAPRT